METTKANNEIDVIGLIITVVHEWKLLLKFLGVGAVIGVIVAFSIPKLYKSEVVLAPEFGSGGMSASGSLAELASSFGVDLGGGQSLDAIYPDLYPDVFSTTDFLMSLYDVPVRLQDDSSTRTYLHHVTKEYKSPFWDMPKLWIAKQIKKMRKQPAGGDGEVDPYYMSYNDWEIIKALRQLLTCSIDKKTSVITITVLDQDPMAAAIMADTLLYRLQDYITTYRTSKARIDVEHAQHLVDEARVNYEKVMKEYSDFSDNHMNSILQSVNSKRDDLENEMQLKYSVYTQAQAQLNLAQAKYQERVPAFTVLQRSVLNPKHINTPKIVILLIWMFLAGLVDAAWVLFIRAKVQQLRKKTDSV